MCAMTHSFAHWLIHLLELAYLLHQLVRDLVSFVSKQSFVLCDWVLLCVNRSLLWVSRSVLWANMALWCVIRTLSVCIELFLCDENSFCDNAFSVIGTLSLCDYNLFSVRLELFLRDYNSCCVCESVAWFVTPEAVPVWLTTYCYHVSWCTWEYTEHDSMSVYDVNPGSYLHQDTCVFPYVDI